MRDLISFFAATALLSASGRIFGHSCNLSTLRVSYAGIVAGYTPNGTPVAYQETAHFDVAGGFYLSGFTYVANGTIVVSDATASGGTYTVKRDCSRLQSDHVGRWGN